MYQFEGVKVKVFYSCGKFGSTTLHRAAEVRLQHQTCRSLPCHPIVNPLRFEFVPENVTLGFDSSKRTLAGLLRLAKAARSRPE